MTRRLLRTYCGMNNEQIYKQTLFIISLLCHFTKWIHKNAQNMPRYYIVEQG